MKKRFLLFVVLLSVLSLGFVSRADDNMLSFPYKWNEETSKTDFRAMTDESDNWGWMAAYNGYWLMTTKNKWVGKVLWTKNPVALPDNGRVAYSFWYNVSAEATLTLRGYTDTDVIELGTVDVAGTGGTYVFVKIEFDAAGPMRLGLEATLTGGNGNCYGSITVKEIGIGYGGADMAAVAILSPEASPLPIGHPVEVKVAYENVSAAPVKNPVFYYEVDGERTSEIYDGTIEANTVMEYVFSTMYVPTDNSPAVMIAGVDHPGDVDNANNEVKREGIILYSPLEFPFFTDFDEFGEYDLWYFVDSDNNGYCWQFGSMPENGVTNSFLGYAASYGQYDDYAVSPAVYVPAGKSRLSFYYAGLNGGSHLTVSVSNKPGIDSNGTVVFDQDIAGEGWKNAYAMLDLPEAGLVYVTFHITGGNDQLLVDKLRIDRLEDLCIKSVKTDVTDGFNLENAHVTVALSNHGLTEQNDIKIRYGVGSLENYVEETVESVLPGETVYHVFDIPVDLSEPGRDYELYAEIATPVGDDSFNDRIKGQTVTHFRNKTIPYVNDFNEDRVTDMWTLGGNSSNGWRIASLTESYSGILGYDDEYRPIRTKTLNHRANSTEVSDSWAFSECIEIPAGRYAFSYFYRTDKGWNDDGRKQDLKVYIGSAPVVDEMKTEIGENMGFLVPGVEWKKYFTYIDIEADGKYYIGFNNVSAAGSGLMQIDRIEFVDADAGKTLPFDSDFVDGADEWYYYNPSEQFARWQPDNGVMRLYREPNTDISGGVHTEGMLVTPALRVDADSKVKVTVNYSLDASYDFTTLVVSKASFNHPDEFVKIKELPVSLTGNEIEFEVETGHTGELRLGFKTNSPTTDSDLYEGYGYDCRLNKVSVSDAGLDSVFDINAGSEYLFVVDGDCIVSEAEAEISIYSVSGSLVRKGVGRVSMKDLSGAYIVNVRVAGTENWKKMVF